MTLGLKVLSMTPVALTLAILFLAAPATFVNAHPNTIAPSDWIFISHTAVPVSAGLKVLSHTPVALTLPIRVLAFPPIVVKVQPMRIFPSLWIAIA